MGSLCRVAAYLNKRLHRIGQKAGRPVNRSVIAPREARRILQGASPCREERQQWLSVRVSHPPVSSLGSMAEVLFVIVSAGRQHYLAGNEPRPGNRCHSRMVSPHRMINKREHRTRWAKRRQRIP